MKAILQSIKSQYCELIAAGIKKIEVRKTKPNIPTPFKVYIYQTKTVYVSKNKDNEFLKPILDNRLGKVIGEYVCDSIDTLLESDTRGKWKDTAKASCLTFQQLDEYSGTDEKPLYLWHISNLAIYDKPKELSEFQKCYTSKNINNPDFHYKEQMLKPLTRPPQSWCYVEEK